MRPHSRPSDRLDKRHVGRSFDRAAATYDGLATLQREVADALLSRMDALSGEAASVVDVGCGTGYCSELLARRLPSADLWALDIAPAMVRTARRRLQTRSAFYVCGDAECLPLADDSADLIVSNLALQWCRDLDRVFAECRRVLKPGGRLLFSTFGPATLQELRAAWARVDDYRHVNDFASAQQVASAMARAGLEILDVQVEPRVSRYGDVLELMRELKGIGAHNVNEGRPRHLVGKGTLQGMIAAYRAQLGSAAGIFASFEIFYGIGAK